MSRCEGYDTGHLPCRWAGVHHQMAKLSVALVKETGVQRSEREARKMNPDGERTELQFGEYALIIGGREYRTGNRDIDETSERKYIPIESQGYKPGTREPEQLE